MKMRKIAAALAVGMGVMTLAGCNLVVKTDEAQVKDAEQIASTVIAKGDGFTITQKDIDDKYKVLLEQIQIQYGDETLRSEQMKPYLEAQKQSIMDQLVRQQLFDKKVVEMKIAEGSADMLAKYDEMVASNVAAFGDKTKFEDAVKSAGYTMESYKAEVLKGLRYDALIAEVIKDIKVEDKDIQEYYDAQKATLYTDKPGAMIYHIFFGTGEDAEAETKANEAKEKLDGGADFEEIAKEYGKDGSAASGGLLGDYAYDTTELGSDFMAEVKKLAEGEISAPVKTSFGWHIIKVTDIRKDSSVKPLEEVKATISETLLNNKQQEKIASTLDAWEKEYNVQRFPDLIKQDSVPLPAPLEVPQTSTTPSTTGAQNTTGTQGATTPASSN